MLHRFSSSFYGEPLRVIATGFLRQASALCRLLQCHPLGKCSAASPAPSAHYRSSHRQPFWSIAEVSVVTLVKSTASSPCSIV